MASCILTFLVFWFLYLIDYNQQTNFNSIAKISRIVLTNKHNLLLLLWVKKSYQGFLYVFSQLNNCISVGEYNLKNLVYMPWKKKTLTKWNVRIKPRSIYQLYNVKILTWQSKIISCIYKFIKYTCYTYNKLEFIIILL